MKKLKIKKYYKIISSATAFLFNSLGLVLAIIGVMPNQNLGTSEKHIMFILAISELFLITAIVYSVYSLINSYKNINSVSDREQALTICQISNKVISENNKALITTYKDCHDKLRMLAEKYTSEIKNTEKLCKSINQSIKQSDNIDDIEKLINEVRSNAFSKFENSLVNQYNRFMVNMLNLTKDSIKEYLSTKGCYSEVSLAIKQLEKPSNYGCIDEKKRNIYTAYRDPRTYNSKKRNETWQKIFCIGENSDFKNSIEKDYYIFNYMTRAFLEERLYLNENHNFYENYNSGVTSTIFSCIKEERVLYGFLACDSLFDDKTQKKHKYGIYDYNIANIMMTTSHIIALYFEDFAKIWDKHIVKEKGEQYTICQAMIERVNKTRYKH